MTPDDIKLYLPKFLSVESERELFSFLADFPKNIDSRMYTTYLAEEKEVFQGDGLEKMLVVNLPEPKVDYFPSMVFSNTCDISLDNKRLFPSQIMYAPIFNLQKYKNTLLFGFENDNHRLQRIESHIQAVRKQKITQLFYLPNSDTGLPESVVFLDRINSCPNKLVDRTKLTTERMFTLSNFGAMLFVLKLSIHFTRIQDKVDRN